MKATITICKDHQEASRHAAGLVAEALAKNPALTATFAAGDTPFACYGQLIQKQQAGGLRLDKARYIGLDEWVGLGPNDAGGCLYSMNEGYYRPANIPQNRIEAFDGLAKDAELELARMRGLLEQYPLELAVLGVGVNGHVGFNEPGVSTDGSFSLVPLSESTQRVGQKYFAGRQTPQTGATITLQALLGAGRVVIIATGAGKQQAVAGILAGESALPVGAFLDHPGAFYVFDEEAAGR